MKRKHLLKVVFQLLLGFMAWDAYAAAVELDKSTLYQQRDQVITGTVADDTGIPLPGVSVSIKGAGKLVVTDASGRYSISAPENSTLVFSYVGFTTQEVNIAGKSVINVTLASSATNLEDVVVIGYQTVRRKDLTGAASTVNTANTQKLVSRSVPEALQGMSAGVQVRNGGAPGQEAVVNIRGLSTLSGNANPLYIIDGMYADPNTTINPADAESIQVLKDASAAAIYGSRAANGVVIITTRKGKEGDPKITVNSRYSISNVPRRIDMMNAADYVRTNTAAYNASGLPVQPGIANYNGTINTNWADELLRTGQVQDYNASISGGSKSSNYLISAGYFKDKGILIARDFDRKSLRINTETRRGRFKLGENLSITNSVLHNPYEGGAFAGNPWYDMWNNVPALPVRSNSLISDNNPGGWGYGSNDNINTFSRNQVAIADITSIRSNFTKLLGNAFLDFEIMKGLSYRFNAGLETSFDKVKSVRREGSWYQNQAIQPSEISDNRSQYLSYLLEHTVNFNYNFDKHSINGVVGYTEQTTQTDNALGGRINLSQFGGNYFTTINSATGDMSASGGLTKYLINSFLSRVNYGYDDRYLATLTFRSDKDSRFSPGYRVGNFPSVALAWRLSNEEFFKVGWITDLKIRGSYGILGNANLGPYQYTAFINQAPTAVFGSDQQAVPGATQARLVSENLRWEEKRTTNLGFDASLLDNRFTIAFDVFRAVSEDVLVPQPLAQYLGNLQGDPLVNIGSIQNKGLELELGYRPAAGGDFKWDIAANVSFIRNKVLKLGSLGIDEATGLPRDYVSSGNTRSTVGRSIGEYYLIRTDGIFQNEAEVAAHSAQSGYARPGDIRYLNLAADGDINDRDRTYAGSPWPKFTTGLQFNSSFKNFSLSMQFYGSFGHKLYNDVRRDLDSYGYSNYRNDLSPWSPANTGTDDPRLGVSYAVNGVSDRGSISNAMGNTDRWLENGSFLRLRNVELGYTISNPLLTKAGVNNVRLFVSGQNLLTITKYKGLDPDVVGANVNLEPGVDNGNYPSTRILSFGLGFGF